MDLPAGTVLLDEHFGTTVVNATDVPTSAVYEAFGQQDRQLFGALTDWVNSTRPRSLGAGALGSYENPVLARNTGLFGRDRYITPSLPYNQMRLAYEAVETDDVVSGVADTSESLAFSMMSFFAVDPDEQDAYNQMAAVIDLDARMREMWRELFTVSQCYVAVWWKLQSFKIRGVTKSGNQRRRTISFTAPSDLTLLDPLKIVPVGTTLFGREQLAYIAEPTESDQFDNILTTGQISDEIVGRLIVKPYQPNRMETAELQELGVNTRHLWLLNGKNVFRHTLTRPSYQRLSPIRMKSVFELLDMKNQLRQMERAHLIGATNFIVLVTKGTDALPAQPAEISNLQAMVRTVARVPILVGDHRLNVEIVTPKLDNTLRAERWNTIDARITGRLWQMFVLGNYSAGAATDDSIKLMKVVARGMESRRHMIRRALENYIFRPMWENNDELSSFPKLMFHPRSIALDFDAAYASFLFDLRQSKELSRETILSQFDLDQELEAENRKREREEYDEIFQTQVPYTAPPPTTQTPTDPQVPPGKPPPRPAKKAPNTRDNGGGRRNGGGAAPGTGQGEEPRRRPARPAASAEDDTAEWSIELAGNAPEGDADVPT